MPCWGGEMGLKEKILTKSLWVYHLSAGSCNNCDIEILDCLTPRFDIERFGMQLVGSVRHADVLLVTGAMNKKALKRLFAAANVSTAMDFLEVFKYCRRLMDDDSDLLEKEEKRLQQLLSKAMRNAQTGQVVQVLEYAFDDDADASKRLVNACLRRLKALDARSPYYLFYSCVVKHMKGVKLPQVQDVNYLKQILRQAEAIQDAELVGRIKKRIVGLEMLVNMCGSLNTLVDDLTEFDELDDYEYEYDDEPDD